MLHPDRKLTSASYLDGELDATARAAITVQWPLLVGAETGGFRQAHVPLDCHVRRQLNRAGQTSVFTSSTQWQTGKLELWVGHN